jgi:acyl carrier protein phosphodiesterase
MGPTFAHRMNFLGHLYLSGGDPDVIVGNFMGDAVKGRDLSRFGAGMERGLRLHRAIDSFTDTHPLVLKGKERLHTYAGRYAGVVMDLFYDHVLARNWSEYHGEPLHSFAQRMYGLLGSREQDMPARTRDMLPYMVRHDWLTSYVSLAGIGRALAGLSTRVPEGEVMRGAEQVLDRYLAEYTMEFKHFLPEVEAHTQAYR